MAKKKPLVPVDTPAFQEAQQSLAGKVGGMPGGVENNTQVSGPSFYEQAQATQQRREASSFGDNTGAMWRQDGIVDGLVAHIAGSHMVPDPQWNPFAPDKWKTLSAGISDDLQPALYDTRSEAHALYVRDLLLQKQQDQQRLGDLGAWGTAGRFAFGAVMPDQMLAGMVGGRVAQVVKMTQVARAARALGTAGSTGEILAADAARTAAVAKVAAGEAKLGSLAAGAAGGAGFNAAFEKIRQNYNFEDDSTQVLSAALMGAGLAVPFGLMHLKGARRLADTAAREAQAVEALRAAHAGEQLTAHQEQIVNVAVQHNKVVRAIESGVMAPDEAHAALEAIHAPHDAALPVPHETPTEPTQSAPTPAPDGFIAKGSIGSGQREAIASIAEQRTAFAKARLDIFAQLNGSENPMVKKLAFGLVKDPIQVDNLYAQGWTASEWKSHLRRTYAGEFFTQSREAVKEAVKTRGLNFYQRLSTGFDRDFHELVTRVTRGDESVLAKNPDIAPSLRKASSAMRKAYDNMYAEAVAAGVKGIDQVSPQDFYVNRQWDLRKMREAAVKHGGWDAIHRLVAGAIKVPDFAGDVEKATKFVGAVRKLEFSPVMQDIMLHSQDMGTLRRELAAHNGKLSSDEIDALIDTMFEAKAKSKGSADAGMATNLKYRFDLDENHVVSTPAGQLRIADLLENDSRMLVDTYFNSMAGHTALAKQGITSKADWDTRMREVSDWFTQNVTQADKAQKHVQLLNDIYANITGRPMSTQDFSTANRVAGAARAYTRSVMLGQLGFAAAFEMKQAAALFGIKSMLQHMPSFSGFLTSLREGHVPGSKLARDISHIAGFGNEMAMSYARHAEVEDGFAGRTLNRTENFTNHASHAVDILSGNAGFTALTRNWSARMFTQQALDWAHRPASLTPKWRERMVGWGISDDDLDHVLDKLKEHSERGPGGRVEGIDYEAWARDSHSTYEKFQLAVSRAARDAVQDHDLGETMPFMHSTLGKVFGELKSFFLVAHAKNMLKNLHYHDATAFQVWGIGLLGEAMGYMTQTAANYAAQPDELQKRLTVERIASASFFRMAAAGMLPNLVDVGYGLATGQSLVQQGTTANTDNRTLVPPSLLMAGRIARAPVALTGLMFGTHEVTQQEARDLAGIIPGSRLMGAAQSVNYLVNTLPKSAPQQGR
jgi:hypothetical protein